jgi:sigma-B regulation protein RsbU (phosphoserine phosphatase)
MSLRKRIQILLAFLVAIPLLLLLVESYRAGRATLLQAMKQESLQIAHLEAAEANLIFEPPRIVTEGLLLALESQAELRPDVIRGLMRESLRRNGEIYGIALALAPSSTPLGRFAPYVYRRAGVETETDLRYEYTERDWYRLPAQSGRARWIDPYFGEGGNTLMVTYAAPVRRQGRIVGVVEVDLDLDGLVQRLRGIRPGPGGSVYLVDRDGQVVAHPDLKAVADLGGNGRLGPLAELMKRRGEDAVQATDPIDRKDSWLVEMPIAALSEARGGKDWSLIVSWPLDRRLAPLGEMARRMLVLYVFLGGAALLFLHRSFDTIVTRPLRRLAEQASRYASGDYDHRPPTQGEASELGELSRALDGLGETLARTAGPGRSQRDGRR